jgi:ATP synthase protein I
MASPPPPGGRRRRSISEQVGAKERRRLRAKRGRERSVFFGLGAFGMIGWSVAVPALLGVALGVWLDARFPGRLSWTLMLLLGGLMAGCLNAWYWVSKEQREIEAEEAQDRTAPEPPEDQP